MSKYEDYFNKFETRFNLKLNEQQKQIVTQSLENNYTVINSGRMSGKWYLQHLIYLYKFYETNSFDKIFGIYQYFYIVYEIPTNGKKTGTYYICSKGTGDIIGEIKWWSCWRKFCLFPYYETVYDSSCLKELYNALDNINIEYKRSKNNVED